MKKFLIFAVLLGAAITYVYSHYTVEDAVGYAQTKGDPKWSPLIEYYAGYYYEMKDRHEEAIKTLEQLQESFPDSAYKGDATFRLGQAYEATRNIPHAKELYEAYLADNPRGTHSDLARRKLELFKSQ